MTNRTTRRPQQPRASQAGPGLVQSLSRGLDILEALSTVEDGLRLTDVAQRVDLSPSTTHRLLTTLEQRGFVLFDRQRCRWRTGINCFAVAAPFLRRGALVPQALPFMRELRADTAAAVNLGIEGDGDVVFLAQAGEQGALRALARPGGRSPLHCSGVGKALLAVRGETVWSGLLRGRALQRRTVKTIVEPPALWRELDAIRRRGFALDNEENAVGLRCVAAVIYDEHARPVAAVSVAAPVSVMSEERALTLGPRIAAIAGRITAAAGGRSPASHAV